MRPDPAYQGEDGFALVEALIAVAILGLAGTLIYQVGTTLNSRAGADLDALSASTRVHAAATLLQARGRVAFDLLPGEAGLDVEVADSDPPELPRGLGGGLRWVTLSAGAQVPNPASPVEVGFVD